jgi:hypothetical protein
MLFSDLLHTRVELNKFSEGLSTITSQFTQLDTAGLIILLTLKAMILLSHLPSSFDGMISHAIQSVEEANFTVDNLLPCISKEVNTQKSGLMSTKTLAHRLFSSSSSSSQPHAHANCTLALKCRPGPQRPWNSNNNEGSNNSFPDHFQNNQSFGHGN